MKIGVVAPGPRASGASRVAWASADALASRGHDVVVVAPGDAHGDAPGGAGRGPRAALLTGDQFRDARRVVQAVTGCDVLHVHRGRGLGPDLVPLAASVAPVVLTLHGAPLSDGQGEAARVELAAAHRVLFPSLAHLVRTRDRFELSGTQVSLVPHGLLAPAASTRRRPRAWRGKGTLALLHLGERSPESGLGDLAEALEGVAGRRARAGRVPLRLVSRGEALDPEFDAQLRARAAGAFEIDLGPPTDAPGLAEIARDCHLAVLPSRRPESYSLELDEVVAAGLPVWLTFGAVAGERFDRSVFEDLPCEDPEAWAAALGALLQDPGSLAAAYAALPERLPSVDVESLLNLYEGALAEHRGAA